MAPTVRLAELGSGATPYIRRVVVPIDLASDVGVTKPAPVCRGLAFDTCHMIATLVFEGWRLALGAVLAVALDEVGAHLLLFRRGTRVLEAALPLMRVRVVETKLLVTRHAGHFRSDPTEYILLRQLHLVACGALAMIAVLRHLGEALVLLEDVRVADVLPYVLLARAAAAAVLLAKVRARRVHRPIFDLDGEVACDTVRTERVRTAARARQLAHLSRGAVFEADTAEARLNHRAILRHEPLQRHVHPLHGRRGSARADLLRPHEAAGLVLENLGNGGSHGSRTDAVRYGVER